MCKEGRKTVHVRDKVQTTTGDEQIMSTPLFCRMFRSNYICPIYGHCVTGFPIRNFKLSKFRITEVNDDHRPEIGPAGLRDLESNKQTFFLFYYISSITGFRVMYIEIIILANLNLDNH